MDQLTDYEVRQLTGQGECHLHTHTKQPMNTVDALQLQMTQPIMPVVSGTELTLQHNYVSIDPAGGTVTIVLPLAIKPKEYCIFSIGSGTVTVTPSGSDTISGSASKSVAAWGKLHIKSNSSGVWLEL